MKETKPMKMLLGAKFVQTRYWESIENHREEEMTRKKKKKTNLYL